MNKIRHLIFVIKNLNLKKVEKKKEEENIKEIKELEFKNKKKKENENNIIRFNEIDNNNIINDNAKNTNNINNEIKESVKKIKIKIKIKRKVKKKKLMLRKYLYNKKEKEKEKDKSNDIINNDNIINANLNIDNIITEGNNKNKSEDVSKIENDKNLEPIMDYNDDEINDLSYDIALQIDKRSYWQFYISLIKTKHEIIYAFFYNKDHNYRIIKIDLFLIGLNYIRFFL